MQSVGSLSGAAGAPRVRRRGCGLREASARRPASSRRCSCASVVASGVRSLRRDKLPGKPAYQEVFGVDLLANGTLTDQVIVHRCVTPRPQGALALAC